MKPSCRTTTTIEVKKTRYDFLVKSPHQLKTTLTSHKHFHYTHKMARSPTIFSETEQRLANALGNIVILLDAQQQLVWWNDTAAELFGLTQKHHTMPLATLAPSLNQQPLSQPPCTLEFTLDNTHITTHIHAYTKTHTHRHTCAHRHTYTHIRT